MLILTFLSPARTEALSKAKIHNTGSVNRVETGAANIMEDRCARIQTET